MLSSKVVRTTYMWTPNGERTQTLIRKGALEIIDSGGETQIEARIEYCADEDCDDTDVIAINTLEEAIALEEMAGRIRRELDRIRNAPPMVALDDSSLTAQAGTATVQP